MNGMAGEGGDAGAQEGVVAVRRALISVSDKTGVVAFAQALAARGAEIVSTGGTAAALREAGLAVREVADVTGSPEMMNGRVKTLHPRIHGGLLARRDDAAHMAALAEHAIPAIDLLAVSLYPFEATVARGASPEDCVENIDIGGPAMLRAAAKNFAGVAVASDPEDYAAILADIAAVGGVGVGLRRRLAAQTFARVAAYDAAVSAWMAEQAGLETPRWRAAAGRLRQPLRYGENPHQRAAFYVDGAARPGVAAARQVQGKEMSYNNIADTDAAFEAVAELGGDRPACIVVKHANPCGAALGDTLAEAYGRAFDCDRVSAFGGVVAVNRPLDTAAAEAITGVFTEVVIAPGADAAALAVFSQKANLRLLLTEAMPDPAEDGLAWRQVSGGWLAQSRDARLLEEMKVVTARAPSVAELADLRFAWAVAKHVKSNAVVYAKGQATVGVGAGQMSRVDSARIAARKAADMAAALDLPETPTKGAAVASDAFFPFADGLEALAEAGATAVIQPGGAMRDAEVIAAADRLGLAMVFTGLRHFRH
ncbi:IMP cyclohydrolase /phosphoribosylaminoimidazolecarboxamide formyltransferase [Rubrimonas cliftonensis]|uniref:Bifunctional purine biosynthesis protein PurH n=2 Tax=Rubrimonas cliftonensis TaxID=89524 RepID=A0A1H3VFK8_9RHOB|nr:IMP cyclohydrolase /phosphoribosylaminoimidazolecarboxamide formyltransferase [Rubrimonas cliftonensis]